MNICIHLFVFLMMMMMIFLLLATYVNAADNVTIMSLCRTLGANFNMNLKDSDHPEVVNRCIFHVYSDKV